MKEKKISVVMSSSFFGFYAHAGFMSALEELDITPYGFGGTSAGALIASLCAAGKSSSYIKEKLLAIKPNDFWDPDYAHLLSRTLVGFKGWKGLLKGNRFRQLLAGEFGKRRVSDYSFPCCILAADIIKKEPVVFHDEKMVDAVYASGTVPGLFQPLIVNDKILFDGGLLAKAPILELYKQQKPDVMIVHYIKSKGLSSSENPMLRSFAPLKITDTLATANRVLSYNLEKELVKSYGCRVVEIATAPPRVNPRKLKTAKSAFEYARSESLKQLAEIKNSL